MDLHGPEHLAEHNFIAPEDISFLEDLTPFLLSKMEYDFLHGNYDFLHGGLGAGYYFINSERPSSITGIKSLLFHLENLSVKNPDGGMKWKSMLDIDTKLMGYNISLSHGMSSIIACLTKLGDLHPLFINETHKIIGGTMKYILQQQYSQPSISYFPEYSLENDHIGHSRLGWCYGDLGIAQAMLQASYLCQNNVWEEVAMKILVSVMELQGLHIFLTHSVPYLIRIILKE